MSMDAYTVAVKIALQENVTRGLSLMSRYFRTADNDAKALEARLKSIGKMTLLGGAMFGAGAGGLKLLEGMVKGGEEYTRQLSLMNATGMKQKEIAESVGAAWKVSGQVLTSSAADNLKTLRELRTVFFGHMDEAYAVLPQVQRASSIMEALTGRKQEGVGFDMVRAIERRSTGNVTGAQLQSNSELMTRAMIGMSGTITANDFHQALSKAKLSALTLNDDFIYKILPTLMQINKGGGGGGAQQAGTQIATASRAIVQGRMLKSMYPMWQEMGLINGSDIVHNAGGSIALRPGAVKGVGMFQANPEQWANEVLAPVVAKYGATHHMTTAQVIQSMFSDRNAANLFGSFILQRQHFDRDAKLIDSVGTSKAGYDKLLKLNPQLAQMALAKQWENIQSVIAFEILPVLVPMMVKFAGALNSVATIMREHPMVTKAAVGGFAALSGAMMVGGGALLLRAAGSAVMLLAPALGGIATAAAGAALPLAALAGAAFLVYRNWSSILPRLKELWFIGQKLDGIVARWNSSTLSITGNASRLSGIMGPTVESAISWLGRLFRFISTAIAGLNPANIPGMTGAAIDRIAQALGYGAPPINPIRPGGHPVQVHTTIKLSERVLAEAVTNHQGLMASRPQTGGNIFDSSRARPSLGMGRW